MHIFDGHPYGEWYPAKLPEQAYIPEAIVTVDQDGTITYTRNVVTPHGNYPQPVPNTSVPVTPAITIGTV